MVLKDLYYSVCKFFHVCTNITTPTATITRTGTLAVGRLANRRSGRRHKRTFVSILVQVHAAQCNDTMWTISIAMIMDT